MATAWIDPSWLMGAHGHGPALVQKGVDLVGRHDDEIPLLDPVTHLQWIRFLGHASSYVGIVWCRRPEAYGAVAARCTMGR
jgi:hypothetical protein